VEKKDNLSNAKSRVYPLAFFILLVAFLLPSQKLFFSAANVAIFPSTVAAGQGESFTINITISSVSRLYGWELKLNWTNSFLDAVNVAEGPFLRAGGDTFFTSRMNNTEGHLIVDCTLLGQVSGVTGAGVLVSVTFYVKAAGQCPLDLYYVSLLDDSPDPQSIPCQTSGGYWSSIGSQHDVSIIDISVTPAAVLSGQIVSINITACNGGVFSETFNVTALVNSSAVGQRTTSLSSGYFIVLPFTWDTTGYGKGDCAVSASASTVPGETNTADNNMTASQKIVILTFGHDIAVTDVRPSKTVVGQGFCMFINVTVRDFGTYSETFNVTTSANNTVIHTDSIILASGLDTLLTLLWNASGLPMGSYTIKSCAEPVNGENDTSDNTYIFGQVTVAKKGDINSKTPNTPDGRVDMWDIAAVARPFSAHAGDSLWNGNADITGPVLGLPDNVIDMRDISTVARSFGP
jgi:hypothetical protein